MCSALNYCKSVRWIRGMNGAIFYKPFAARPVGMLPVWIGYDPTDSGDAAALVVVLPPRSTGDKFRIIEHTMLRGNNFEEQAAFY